MNDEVLLLIIFFGVMGFATLLVAFADYWKEEDDDE